MTIEGVDYSTSRPKPSALVTAGKKFVVRYGGPGSSDKHLTQTEFSALKAAGIAVVANAEGASNGFRGFAAGQSWARSAHAHFSALGMPINRPIYFSVDWDAGPASWGDIDAALSGADSVIGVEQVGVYGGYDVIAHCASVRTARWFWQTYAWSGGRLHPAAHLYQYRNGVTIAGADVDLTRALRTDFGQWGAGIGDDVSKEDVTAALREFFVADDPQADGTPDSLLGRLVLNQGVPNGTKSADAVHGLSHSRTRAWQAIEDIGAETVALRREVAALAARPAATVSPEDLKTAVLAALREILVRPAP